VPAKHGGQSGPELGAHHAVNAEIDGGVEHHEVPGDDVKDVLGERFGVSGTSFVASDDNFDLADFIETNEESGGVEDKESENDDHHDLGGEKVFGSAASIDGDHHLIEDLVVEDGEGYEGDDPSGGHRVECLE